MKHILIGQYQAGLKMMDNVIRQCPDELWPNTNYPNAYWHIVYHTLFYTSLYLSKNEETFSVWPTHRFGDNRLENSPQNFYSKRDLHNYTTDILQSLQEKITEESLSEQSEFEWLVMTRLELHLYNLRHLQHHIGQLVERLHQNGIFGITWIGSV